MLASVNYVVGELPFYHLSVILTKNGDVIAYGLNENKRNGVVPSTHSEVSAIRKMMQKRRQLNPKLFRKGVVMINFAYTFTGRLRISKPCEHCQKFLEKYSFIKDIWFSNRDGGFEQF